ncbi:MAG: helix-turn-helix domain-containing protein, partial [Bacteriovorax sp.]|nr:helix-turn-helix domain-containing protein [Bacteriovorax sp.]
MNELKNEIFKKKKIKNFGEFIKFHREKNNFSIEELSSKTKIRIKQLENIECNNFMDLPSKVYLIGFLKTICSVLKIETTEAIKYLDQANTNEPTIYINKIKNNMKSDGLKKIGNELRGLLHMSRLTRALFKVVALGVV